MLQKSEQSSVQAEKSEQSPLQVVLGKLIDTKGLRVSQIARKIQVPETTIRYVLYGISKRPSVELLKKLADYFGVTIEYLIGKEKDNVKKDTTDLLQNNSIIKKVPLLDIDHVKQWVANQKSFDPLLVKSWVVVDENLHSGSFAICFDRAIKGLFYENSVLLTASNQIINPGDYVIASVNKKKTTIKRVWKEQEEYYLESVGTREVMEKITSKDAIFGKVIEIRRFL